jgi:predicted ester cyclase
MWWWMCRCERPARSQSGAARLTHTATHLGPFMGIPPTGRAATITATGIFRIQDGRLIENHVIFDALGLLRQLGVVPELATP